jgi:ketosteroid isomerase-like protein
MIARFNAGKIDAMVSLFALKAVFIAADGTTVTDRAQIAAELERTLSLGLPMEAKARHMFVADNVAQVVLGGQFSSGTGPDGKHVHLPGMASDVLRCGTDGLWRVLIDNNHGTAVRRPI